MTDMFDDWQEAPEIICKVTGSYCTGQFCEDYGCAKEAGFHDEEDGSL